MNVKRYVFASVTAFVVIFAFDFVFHGIVLKDLYMETAQLWRGEAEWANYAIFMTVAQALTAFVLGLIFVKGHENKGIGEGVRYGLLIGMLFAAVSLGTYSYTPISPTLAIYWIVGSLVEYLLVGTALAAVYRPN